MIEIIDNKIIIVASSWLFILSRENIGPSEIHLPTKNASWLFSIANHTIPLKYLHQKVKYK